MTDDKLDKEINTPRECEYLDHNLIELDCIDKIDEEKIGYMNDVIGMNIENYYTTHLNTESNTEEEDNSNNVNNDNSSIDIDGNSIEERGEDTIFPVISEPLKTFVTVNPATLEDEELWSLSNLKNLCEYIGLSVSGNRKSILNRLQNWNGAPLSGAGHPDLYDTRSGRFHTIPMAYLDDENALISPEKSKNAGVILESINHHKMGFNINENDNGNILLLKKDLYSPELLKKVNVKGGSKDEKAINNEGDKGLIDGDNSSLNGRLSTPIKNRKNISSLSSSNSNCRSNSKLRSKSTGRICFSPYNHVRVFVPNPGERELNIDPNSILRLGYDEDESSSDYLEDYKDMDTEDYIIRDDCLDQS
ncbi:hypothetical protein RS030_6755 [Cryptosporidium xiaoi]|uniref:SAP domain-containing protein n=1 Tax=Cryptosporidium xiaoi TaxID=659607 RepID=A0AAV9XXN8_9CRYT